MANPKYIDEALLPDATEEESSRKVTKKPYSFRCDERLLDGIDKYAELEGITVPQVLSNIMDDFLKRLTLTNTYLPEYEGMYINIPSNVGKAIYHEYDLRYVVNNLDEWTSEYGYISKNRMHEGILHEGIDFLVIPETVHTSKLPDDEVGGGRGHHVNLEEIPSCLYCIYMTVDRTGLIEIDNISWITAMNKLKAVGRYDLISHGNKIKKRLNSLYETYITERQWTDDRIFIDEMYGRLRVIADKYNTGAILPAAKSIDNIEYAAIVESLPDIYDLINKLVKENMEITQMAAEITAIKSKIDDLNKLSDEEILDNISQGRVDDLPESDDEITLQGSNDEELVLQRSHDQDEEVDDHNDNDD